VLDRIEVEREKARLQRTIEKEYQTWVVEGEVNPSLSAQRLDPNVFGIFFLRKAVTLSASYSSASGCFPIKLQPIKSETFTALTFQSLTFKLLTPKILTDFSRLNLAHGFSRGVKKSMRPIRSHR